MRKVIMDPHRYRFLVLELLARVFEAMEKSGYTAVENAHGCPKCALRILQPSALEWGTKGCVYWSYEDKMRFQEESRMFVHYFTVADTDDSFKEMTDTLTMHMKDEGLLYVWGGSYDRSIEIIGFDDKRKV
jgi:hypothetical protein